MPTIDLSESYPKQGGFLMVRLLDATAGLPDATVAFNGQQYAMLREGERWFAVVGMGTGFQVGDYPIEVDSSSTGAVAAGTVSIADGGFQYESIDLPPSSADLTSDQNAVNQERATLNQTYAVFTPERRWSGDWILPAQGTLSDGYGLMRSINGAPYYPHSGTDIANEIGTPVVASNDGVVALAVPLYLFGNAVIVDHGAGVFSSYNHLNGIVAQVGQVVKKGDLLGYMGQTGYVNGPHVHWEIIVSGVRVNAMLWTRQPEDP